MTKDRLIQRASDLYKKIKQDEMKLRQAALLFVEAIAARQNRPEDEQEFSWAEMVNTCELVKETFEHDLIQNVKEQVIQETGFRFTLHPAEEPPVAA
jgi:hypothetical protein